MKLKLCRMHEILDTLVAATQEEELSSIAFLDRLLRHCTVINIKGHGYSLKGKVFAHELSQQEGGAVTVRSS